MTPRLLCLVSAVLPLVFAAPAWAQSRTESGYYIGGSLAYAMSEELEAEGRGIIDRDDGLLVTLAVGYDMGLPRFDVELGWQTLGGAGDGDLSVWTTMVNGYVDFATGTAFTPYLGAGIGVGTVYVDGVRLPTGGVIDDEDRNFAYQLMGGISYAVNHDFDVYGGYRYLNVIDTEFTATTGGSARISDAEAHNFELGLRYRF